MLNYQFKSLFEIALRIVPLCTFCIRILNSRTTALVNRPYAIFTFLIFSQIYSDADEHCSCQHHGNSQLTKHRRYIQNYTKMQPKMDQLPSDASMHDIRRVIRSHAIFKFVKQTGKGRTKKRLINEVNEIIRTTYGSSAPPTKRQKIESSFELHFGINDQNVHSWDSDDIRKFKQQFNSLLTTSDTQTAVKVMEDDMGTITECANYWCDRKMLRMHATDRRFCAECYHQKRQCQYSVVSTKSDSIDSKISRKECDALIFIKKDPYKICQICDKHLICTKHFDEVRQCLKCRRTSCGDHGTGDWDGCTFVQCPRCETSGCRKCMERADEAYGGYLRCQQRCECQYCKVQSECLCYQ